MTTEERIQAYIDSQSTPKCSDLQTLHERLLLLMPKAQLWFLDGKNSEGKIVSNPNIGYGKHTIRYVNGSTKAFHQIGLSANTSGISVYLMGLADKNYLATTFGASIGKASITGYCIKFKNLKDIHVEVLEAAIQYTLAASQASN
jgi:hypothetical protein